MRAAPRYIFASIFSAAISSLLIVLIVLVDLILTENNDVGGMGEFLVFIFVASFIVVLSITLLFGLPGFLILQKMSLATPYYTSSLGAIGGISFAIVFGLFDNILLFLTAAFSGVLSSLLFFFFSKHL